MAERDMQVSSIVFSILSKYGCFFSIEVALKLKKKLKYIASLSLQPLYKILEYQTLAANLKILPALHFIAAKGSILY